MIKALDLLAVLIIISLVFAVATLWANNTVLIERYNTLVEEYNTNCFIPRVLKPSKTPEINITLLESLVVPKNDSA